MCNNPSNEVLTQLLTYGNMEFPVDINRNILELTLRFINETVIKLVQIFAIRQAATKSP